MPAENPSFSSRLCDLLRRGLLHCALTTTALLWPSLVPASDRLFGELEKVLMPVPAGDGLARYATALGAEGLYRIQADFRSHGGDPLTLNFTLEQAASRASMQAFGISADELDALRRKCISAGNCNQDEFDQRLQRYYREHKLRLRTIPGQRPRLFVDIPEVVRQNRAHVSAVAAALRQLGSERSRDAGWIFDAAVALVQGGLEYRRPSAQDGGRQTLGFYTPPRALEKGYGDCDTKSALLAAILLNLGSPRIIGVHVPDHYLLGVARAPRQGEAYLDYGGEPYVLVEAAGPAQRRPGEVAARTRLALDAGDSIRIDPMF